MIITCLWLALMLSLNYKLLITTSLEETIKNCVNDLFSNNFYSGKLSRNNLKELLKLAATQSSFIFDNKLYKQTNRAAMGSPLGHTLTNAILCHHKKIWLNECPSQFQPVVYRHYEKNWLNECSSQFKPVVYRRYVDHIVILFKSKEHLKLL